MKRLAVDTSNILFRVASAHGKYNAGGSPEDQAGLALHMALNTLKSFYRRVKPDQVAMAFEGADNWRKTYTRSEQCVSKRGYKANRVKDDSLAPFFELIRSFEDLARNHTSLVCLSHPLLEGDDSLAAYTQHYSALGDEVIILSGDKDFKQLLKLPGVSILNPDKLGDLRTCDDPEFFMFEKAIRGDAGDNVISAYPRVRMTRIEKAYKNEYEKANLFNETWEFLEPSDGTRRTFRVGDLFEENQLLMNLERQPDHIRAIMKEMVETASVQHGKFDLFYFQKFCGKYGLKKISEDVTSYIELFSSTGINSPFKAETKAFNEEKKKRASTLVF